MAEKKDCNLQGSNYTNSGGGKKKPGRKKKPVPISPTDNTNEPPADETKDKPPVETPPTVNKKEDTVEIIKPKKYILVPTSLKPDADCKLCNGTGSMLVDGKKYDCHCVREKQLLRHLTNEFINAGTIPNFKVGKYLNRNILLENKPREVFNAIVKSFHLYTFGKINFITATGNDVIRDMFQDDETGKMKQDERYRNITLLFLILGEDPVNKLYSTELRSLIDRRVRNGLFTWVYAEQSIDSVQFKNKYSTSLAEYISKIFQPPGK